MKVAFACWDNHIAPVFDTVRQIYLIETDSVKILSETQEAMFGNAPLRNVTRLAELEVGTLICGAISRPVQEMVTTQGIHVISFVAGELSDVIQAWMAGDLSSERYAMPGCCLGRGTGKGRGLGRLGLGRGRVNDDTAGNSGRGLGGGNGRGCGLGGGNGMGRGRSRAINWDDIK